MSQKVLAFTTSLGFVFAAVGASVALAALTLNATSIVSDGVLNLTGASSSVIDLGSGSTLSLQTTNNGPINSGSGLFTVGGGLTVNGTFTATNKIALSNLATSTAGNIIVVNGSNVPTFVSLSGDATLSSAGALTLATSGVSAATYGSASIVPVITVDAKGRVTSVTTSSVTVGSVATSSVTGVFTLVNGGWGVTSLTANGVVYGNGTSSPLVTAAPTAGQLLVGNASNVPTFVSLSGDIASVSATGSVVLAASNGNLTTLSAISSIDRAGVMSIGNTNATGVTLGRSGQTVSFPGNASTTGSATFLSALTQSGGTASLATTTVGGSLTISGGTPILKHLSATSSITFGVIASSSCATLTMTVTGANAGDNVYAAPTPVANGLETVSATWSAYASSTNTVAIKACNPTITNTASVAAEVWRADVWQH